MEQDQQGLADKIDAAWQRYQRASRIEEILASERALKALLTANIPPNHSRPSPKGGTMTNDTLKERVEQIARHLRALAHAFMGENEPTRADTMREAADALTEASERIAKLEEALEKIAGLRGVEGSDPIFESDIARQALHTGRGE